jgi:DHA2 family methylenomycin A resistance protein-like MFS transporter
MLPLSLFRSSYVSTACFVGLVTNFSYYGLMFVLSLFFLTAKGYSPLATGLAFLPMTAQVTIASLVAGWLTTRFGPKLPMVLGPALSATGYLALSGISVETPYKFIVVPLLAAGVGAGLTVTAMTAAVLANIESPRAGIASGALNAARQTGRVIGVGVFGSLVAGGMGGLESGMHLALILAGLALALGCVASLFGIRPQRNLEIPLSTIEANMDGMI